MKKFTVNERVQFLNHDTPEQKTLLNGVTLICSYSFPKYQIVGYNNRKVVSYQDFEIGKDAIENFDKQN